MKTLYYNGEIITMENEESPECVLTNNGKIEKVGNLVGDEIDKTVKLFDLKGSTLLPAFIDCHSHLSAYASSLLQVPLENCNSFSAIGEKIKSYIIENKISPNEWVIGKGYNTNSLQENEHPNISVLDKCAPNNPVVVQNASGHMGVFNSLALKLLNVDNKTTSPEGGLIQVQNGKLTGYMEENAFFKYFKLVPMPEIDILMNSYLKAQEKYASYGITTVQEGMTVAKMIPMYKQLTEKNLLKLDLNAYMDLKDSNNIISEFKNNVKKYNSNLKLAGFKIFLDGSPQGKTAWMLSPYKNSPNNYCGYGTMTDEEVLKALSFALKNNMQILAHCNGDAAAQQFINCAMKIKDIQKIRPVMIHAQLLGENQLAQVKKLGIIPSFFVAHIYNWGDVHIENFGFNRAKDISPTGYAMKNNVMFTFHQDTPVIEPNVLETIWCAVNRVTKNGIILGENQKISVYEALKAVTINGAYQYFEENIKGSIKVGKNADFVILDKNPLTVKSNEIKDIKVLCTIKDDKIIYKQHHI